MDSYEWICWVYEKIQYYPTNTTLLKQYSSYLEKYIKFTEGFDKWDEDDMNDAEIKYYLEVQSRVSKKLSEVS